MTKKVLTHMVKTALRDAGYEGDVCTSRRKVNGKDHTEVRRPSEGAFEYLSGYLGDDAKVWEMTNGSLVIEWAN